MKAIALGNFDGVHIAHKAVLQNAARFEESVCLLFRQHPAEALEGKPFSRILTPAQTQKKILQSGIGCCEYLDFEAHKDDPPEQFFEETLCRRYRAEVLCCGYNYSFGQRRQGNVALLRQLCESSGIELIVAEPIRYGGAPISSTRIKQCLGSGAVEQANAMLGYPFFYEGEIVKGKRLGRKLGFPTLNQWFGEGQVKPRAGVYAVRVTIGAQVYRGVSNIGANPTIGSDSFRSETHVFDFDKEVYGQSARIELLRFIRPEKTIERIDALQQQVLEDIERAKENVGTS